jgi:16S rRNA (adenine1518-N6/adenine1519-N6)-dimethyltransferase
VRTAFAKRRKMLRSALAGVVSAEQFAAAHIDPTARAEQLGIVDWGRLAQVTASSNESTS